MRNRIMILILTIVQHNFYGQIQIDSLLVKHEFDSSLIRIKVDALGNLWKVYPHKIVRHSETPSYNDSFSARFINAATTIDAKFPLKTLFYNSNTNTIHVVNSRWGILSEIKLDNLGIYQPSSVNYCADGSIWILDKNSNRLFRINENATKKIDRINPFQASNQSYFPQIIIDYKACSIAFDSSYGYFTIDNYGSLMSAFMLPVNTKIIEGNGNYFLQNEMGLYRMNFNPTSHEWTSSKNFIRYKEPVLDIVVSNNNIILRTSSNKLYYFKNFLSLFNQ